MSDVKICAKCGGDFDRRARDSAAQWAGRRFCSAECANRSRPSTPAAARLDGKFQQGGQDECWPWIGSLDRAGYGQVSSGRQGLPPKKAHRVMWERTNGPIPDGLVIRHKCDNPPCVNPGHLEIGTQKDNTMDTSRRGRLNPVSRLNLRPGSPGYHGAGPISNGEK